MKIAAIFRGLSSRKVTFGSAQSIERLPIASLKGFVSKIVIHYTSCTQQVKYWLPWHKGEEVTAWMMRVDCITKDGRRISNHFASEAPLKNALNYGYLKGMEATLTLLREESQMHKSEERA